MSSLERIKPKNISSILVTTNSGQTLFIEGSEAKRFWEQISQVFKTEEAE